MTHYILKKTLELIIQTKNHFLVCVKRNHKRLHNMLQRVSSIKMQRQSYYSSKERNKGRIEKRSIYVFQPNSDILNIHPYCKSVIRVLRERTNKGKTSFEEVFYISDLNLKAKEFGKRIRNHWSIENKLHYIKDVILNEDNGKMKNKIIAPIFSLIRSLLITLSNIFDKSFTSFQRTFAYNTLLVSMI